MNSVSGVAFFEQKRDKTEQFVHFGLKYKTKLDKKNSRFRTREDWTKFILLVTGFTTK